MSLVVGGASAPAPAKPVVVQPEHFAHPPHGAKIADVALEVVLSEDGAVRAIIIDGVSHAARDFQPGVSGERARDHGKKGAQVARGFFVIGRRGGGR